MGKGRLPFRTRTLAGFALALGLAAAANLAASLVMAVVLAGATPAGGDAAARLAYVAAHRRAVVAGWGTWVVATLTLLLSLWVLARLAAPRRRGWCQLALLFAAVGASLDIAADVLNMTAVPALAEEAARLRAAGEDASAALAAFSAWDAAAVALTGGGGNSLYALAGAMITWALAGTAWVPRYLVLWGAAVWAAAGLASAALFWSPPLLPPAVGATMVLYVSWMAAAGLWLGRAARRAEAGGR